MGALVNSSYFAYDTSDQALKAARGLHGQRLPYSGLYLQFHKFADPAINERAFNQVHRKLKKPPPQSVSKESTGGACSEAG